MLFLSQREVIIGQYFDNLADFDVIEQFHRIPPLLPKHNIRGLSFFFEDLPQLTLQSKKILKFILFQVDVLLSYQSCLDSPICF